MMQAISSLSRGFCVIAVGWLLLPGTAVLAFEAQSVPTPVPAAPVAAKDAAESNNPKAQIRVLTESIGSGQLGEDGLARALLKRGVAHSSLGHYSQALVDLTGAIYIGKLNETELRQAYGERARAYQETGQPRMAEVDSAKASGAAAMTSPRRTVGVNADADVSALKLPEFKTNVAPVAAGAAEPMAPPAAVAKPLPSFKTSIAHE